MYGTIAKLKVKPGMLPELMKLTSEEDMDGMAGFVNTIVYQMDADANEIYMVVLFTDKDAYVKNANDPAQDTRYREFVKYLDGEPEWHDGEIIYNHK